MWDVLTLGTQRGRLCDTVTAPTVQTPEPCHRGTSGPGVLGDNFPSRHQKATRCPLFPGWGAVAQFVGDPVPTQGPRGTSGHAVAQNRGGGWGGCSAPAAGRGRLSLAWQWFFGALLVLCFCVRRKASDRRELASCVQPACVRRRRRRQDPGGFVPALSWCGWPCPVSPMLGGTPQGPSSQAPRLAPRGVFGFLGAHAAESHFCWWRHRGR